jgi:uncharacterized protein (TIGR03437 family)
MIDERIRMARFIMKAWTALSWVFFLLLPASAGAQTAYGWKLIWSDEFNGPQGSPPDPSEWNYDLGGGGWGNGEAETYTDRLENAFQDGNGNLVIRAIRDNVGNYTSARLQTGSPGASTHTADGNWQYGLILARVKIPFGKGIWPAFWMLGANFTEVGWPTCGEIDIMENFGTFHDNATINNGTAHGPGYSGANGISKSYTLPLGQRIGDDFHVFAILWTQDSIEWFVDGVSYQKITPSSLPVGRQWVFNGPFFILLNLAIGGPTTFLGEPDLMAPFQSQDMLVDYVRVYEAANASAETPVLTPGRVVNAASWLETLAPGSIVTLYGYNLADAMHSISGVDTFPRSVAGVAVAVNGIYAPLLYTSPTQIIFQIPWETLAGPTEVKVIRNGVESNIENVTVVGSAPSAFLNDVTSGIAWMTGRQCGATQCSAQPGEAYQLWGNGFGPKNTTLQTGSSATLTGSLESLEVLGGSATCKLTVGGLAAVVQYCGAAPGEIIDQLNFIYPAGVVSNAAYVDAILTINGSSGRFRLPAPIDHQ